MEYARYDQGDERLLELVELPLENGIALAMRTTGYSLQDDEIIELSIVDFSGNELFSKRAKPQNVESWEPSPASGGIAPADVEDLPELYQFEDEIMALFENADIVVCEHLDFARTLIEGSWIALPVFEGLDLCEEFRLSHCAADYPDEPASAVAFSDIANYYGVDNVAAGVVREEGDDRASSQVTSEAITVAACYRRFVEEQIATRDGKGAEYWEERERRLAEEAVRDANVDAVAKLREKRLNQMNGLLWISGAIIFISLVIQLYQRGWDMGFMVVAGAVAVFCLIRGIANFRK